MSSAIESTIISTESVKSYLSNLVNSDVTRQVSDLNAQCKDYRTFKYQLKEGIVQDVDEDGKVKKVAVEVLDENGEKMYKKSNKKEAITRDVSVTHPMTDDERKFREQYIKDFETTFKDLKKRIRSFNEHKIKFPKMTVKVLNSKIQEIAVNYLICGYNHAKNVHLTMKASKETSKNASKKPKIKLSHMVSCDYNSVSGIKIFMGKSFSDALRSTFDKTLQIATTQARAEAVKEIKEEGYVEGKELKERKAAVRQLEKKRREEEELELYGNLTLKEIKARKEELKKSPKKEKKETKTEEKEETSKKYIFANAIKRTFKEHDQIKSLTKTFSVSSEVMNFIEQQCIEFLNHVASYAYAVCRYNKTKTFRVEDLAAFLIGLTSNSISVSSQFTSETRMVPSEDEYKKVLERNKEEAKKKGTEPEKVDRDSLPKEVGYVANATNSYSGAFADSFSYFNNVLESIEEKREKDKLERDAKKETAKQVEQTAELTTTETQKKKKPVPVDSDSDSDSDEEPPQQVVKKTSKRKQ